MTSPTRYPYLCVFSPTLTLFCPKLRDVFARRTKDGPQEVSSCLTLLSSFWLRYCPLDWSSVLVDSHNTRIGWSKRAGVLVWPSNRGQYLPSILCCSQAIYVCHIVSLTDFVLTILIQGRLCSRQCSVEPTSCLHAWRLEHLSSVDLSWIFCPGKVSMKSETSWMYFITLWLKYMKQRRKHWRKEMRLLLNRSDKAKILWVS